MLYSNNRLVPGNVEIDHGLTSTIRNSSDRPVRIASEFLDRPEFTGEDYDRTVAAYLRQKYEAHLPHAIVSVSDEALEFLLRNRSQLFPGVPLVYAVASKSFLKTISPMPADAVGVPIEYDYSGTIEQALRWHPTAHRLVVVTGASERDRGREARLRREIPSIAPNVTVEFLSALPTESILQRLRQLDADAVVFTPGFFKDGSGQLTNPRDSAALMAAAAAAPVYGPVDTFIGTGVVGGRMPSFEEMGRQAGQIVNELLSGAAPGSLRLPEITPSTLQVDWRQVRRWGIDENQIPDATAVHFRIPTFWQAYRTVALVVVAVIVLQAVLIAALLLERRRRRNAEVAVQKQRSALAHASRLAIAGELTASIAHEINQPLGAVQTSADAADLILKSGGERREDLLRIVTRIRRDNMRASDVIRRLRMLLARHEPERHPIDVNVAVSDVATFVQAEARRRRVSLEFKPATVPALISGDQTQIQQVLINLVLNAMDAMVDLPESQRTIVISVERIEANIAIVVRDRGHGVAHDHLPRLFDSFFSTKQKGMGLGLSIARTIVEAHCGRIWAEQGLDVGAVFHVELPAYDGASPSSTLPK